MASPFLSEGTDLLLECPRVARLLVKLPIRLGHRCRPHESFEVKVLHRCVALSFPDSITDPGSIHSGIDYEMRDVDSLRPQFSRGALRNCAEPKFCGRERRVSDSAAQTGRGACEENRSAPTRQHQAGGFPACDESGVTGHLPDFAEHAVGRLDQWEVDVCADIEDADLEWRMLVSVLQESGEVIFLPRVERSSKYSAAICLDLGDQWRELVAVAASGENGKTFGREFFGDCGADVISSPDHRRRGISVLQRNLSLRCVDYQSVDRATVLALMRRMLRGRLEAPMTRLAVVF